MKTSQPLYNHPIFRAVTGDVLRPGGLSLTNQLVLSCGWPPKAKVADVGCGAGATLKMLQEMGYSAVGFDPDAALLKQAAKKSFAETILAPAHCLPVADGAFSGMVCECVLSLTPNPLEVLKEFHRALQPGGQLILSDVVINNEDEKEPQPDNQNHKVIGILLAETTTRRLMEADFSIVNTFEAKEIIKKLVVQLLWAGLDCGRSFPPQLCGGRKLSYAFWVARKND